ncbi:polyphenol oxidase family protein [Bifidobacterium sp. ESL0745]|uniref:polyphenol oxidase family protein n=1 Tax=Bifidobacterium sp. ESL0745 TaxID=2983226 RepID=UPI0023FA1A7A|nr:polyphenol oxidase family protein [Bifidobacterium sp. ESL0745]MDF7665535.1 polyphenol oxidase family protein [Bifidobacterium sp. ESL0745]
MSKHTQYDDAILDSNAISPVDGKGNPIPVTIPIDLAPGVKIVYTTRLGGLSTGDWSDLNLGGKSGDDPAVVEANRVALAKAVGAPLSLVAQVHSGRAVDVDEIFKRNAPYGCDFSGTVIDSGQHGQRKTAAEDDEIVVQKGIEEIETVDGAEINETEVRTEIRESESSDEIEDSPINTPNENRKSQVDNNNESPSETQHDMNQPASYPRLEADAEVSAQTGVALGMFAADCLPVLLADPQAGVIAAAHCGRKGLQRGVIGSVVDLMVAKGAKPERIVATLGPCVCGDCYEVGEGIADEFDAQFPGTFTLTRFGGPGIDIAKAALQELAEAGIPRDNVIDSAPRVRAATQYLDQDAELAALCAQDGEGSPDLSERIGEVRHSLCTLENPLWYSHRRASLAHKKHEGRLLALIVRE